MLRVGIIGCGRIADLHVMGYVGRTDAQIVALCDTSIDMVRQRAQDWHLGAVSLFDDYRSMCDSGSIDLVEIVVPHHLHFAIAEYAIGSGLHVSLQKPMTLNLEEAEILVELASKSDKTVRLYENFMFYPPTVKAVQLIEEGLIGRPLAVRLKSNSGYSPEAWNIPKSSQEWRHDPAACGGGHLVFDDGHHKFALAWLFLGQPTDIHAWIGTTETKSGPLDSPAIVSMRYGNDAIGSLEVIHSPQLLIEGTAHYAQDDRLEITGERGVIWVNRGHGQLGNPPPVASYADGNHVTYDCPTGWEYSFIHATRHYLDAIGKGTAPALSLAQSRDILATALAAQESALNEQAVLVPAAIGSSPRDVRAQLRYSKAIA